MSNEKMEFRKGGPQQDRSVHPLHYLPYINMANFKKPRLDRTNFYSDNGAEKRAVRLFFEALDRREGDLQAVEVELKGDGGATRSLHVNFDDRATISSAKGDDEAFKNGIAVEGYQKSNLKGDGLLDLHYGVLVKDIPPEDKSVKLSVLDVKNGKLESAEFPLPELKTGEEPVDSDVDKVETRSDQNRNPANDCRLATGRRSGGPHRRRYHSRRARYQFRRDFA